MQISLRGLAAIPLALLTLGLPAFAQDASHTAPRALVELGSGAADSVFPRTVKHVLGETTLESEPKRVAIISTGQFDSALAVGVVPIATTRGTGQSGLVDPYLVAAYPELADQFEQVLDLGLRLEIDLEALADARPDLILFNAAEDTPEERAQYEMLSKIAPTVVTNATGVNWKVIYLLAADALGRRGQAQAFATDPIAREVARGAIALGYDIQIGGAGRLFFYMPFQHSEDLADQELSLSLFEGTSDARSLDFARQHHATIARFGRFPHRNAALGRTTLPAEAAAVAEGSQW